VVNREDGEGIQVPCLLQFRGAEKFIKIEMCSSLIRRCFEMSEGKMGENVRIFSRGTQIWVELMG